MRLFFVACYGALGAAAGGLSRHFHWGLGPTIAFTAVVVIPLLALDTYLEIRRDER